MGWGRQVAAALAAAVLLVGCGDNSDSDTAPPTDEELEAQTAATAERTTTTRPTASTILRTTTTTRAPGTWTYGLVDDNGDIVDVELRMSTFRRASEVGLTECVTVPEWAVVASGTLTVTSRQDRIFPIGLFGHYASLEDDQFDIIIDYEQGRTCASADRPDSAMAEGLTLFGQPLGPGEELEIPFQVVFERIYGPDSPEGDFSAIEGAGFSVSGMGGVTIDTYDGDFGGPAYKAIETLRFAELAP